VAPEAVAGVAGGGENVFHMLQRLPGVTPADELGGRISVRGGGPDENLTVIDGVEVHNPYRLATLFSAFNPDTIQSFQFYAGAFSARYGDRLSSLLTVQTRDGTHDEKVAGSAGLSLLDANALLEGRLAGGRASWLVAGRRTYYDLVAEPLIRGSQSPFERRASSSFDLPAFKDVHAKVAWAPGERHKIALLAQLGDEHTEVDDKRGTEDFTQVRAHDGRHLFALTYHGLLSSRLSVKTVASTYEDGESLAIQGLYPSTAGGPLRPTHVDFTQEQSVIDHGLRHEVTIQASSHHTLAGGFELHRLETHLAWNILGDRDPTHTIGSVFRVQNWETPGDGLPAVLDSMHATTRSGLWVEERAQLASALTAQAQLRVDHSGLNQETIVAPRASIVWTPKRGLRVRAAGGLYTQSPGYEKAPDADYVLDLGSSPSLALRSQRAVHVLLGTEIDLDSTTSARVELYDKRFDRVWIGALETETESAARAARYDFPASLQSSIPSVPLVTTRATNDGRGSAYGLDVFIERKPSSPFHPYGWVSYSYGRATREAYGRTYPADYDLRHAMSVAYMHRWKRWLSVAATARIASGLPFTPAVGVRVAARPDATDVDRDGNRDELVPARDAQGFLIYEAWLGGTENINSARRAHFARVDLRTTFHIRRHVRLYLDVVNVLNHKNPGTPQQTAPFNPASSRDVRENEGDFSLPILPSVGVHISF
jgi:hypothetical protein